MSHNHRSTRTMPRPPNTSKQRKHQQKKNKKHKSNIFGNIKGRKYYPKKIKVAIGVSLIIFFHSHSPFTPHSYTYTGHTHSSESLSIPSEDGAGPEIPPTMPHKLHSTPQKIDLLCYCPPITTSPDLDSISYYFSNIPLTERSRSSNTLI